MRLDRPNRPVMAPMSHASSSLSNHIRRFKRPEYIAHRDFSAIECLPDDCLLKHYPVDLPWKNGMPGSALVTSSEPIADTRKAA